MNEGKAEFKTHWGSTVYFRTGTHPDSAEGIPNVRRVWLDEGGKVSLYFFENLMGRAARVEAPVDITTTPYAMNWLGEMVDDARKGKRTDLTAIHCKSKESPYFSTAEYDRQKGLLDPRRFTMKYDGEFGQMQGLVYDIYDQCLVDSFPLPKETRYFGGIDWGYYPDPFAFVVRGLTPQGRHYRVAEYYANYKTISDIVKIAKDYQSIYQLELTICDPSQPAHIEELNRNGVPSIGGKNDIRFGIDKHYELMRAGRFYIFQDKNPIGRDEYSTYHYMEERELGTDEGIRKKEKLPVDKNNHGIDIDRYQSVYLLEAECDKRIPKLIEGKKREETLYERIQRLKRQNQKYSGT